MTLPLPSGAHLVRSHIVLPEVRVLEFEIGNIRACLTCGFIDLAENCDCTYELATFALRSSDTPDLLLYIRDTILSRAPLRAGYTLPPRHQNPDRHLYISKNYASGILPGHHLISIVPVTDEELAFANKAGVECLDAILSTNARLALELNKRPLVKIDSRGTLFRRDIRIPSYSEVKANCANTLTITKVRDPVLGFACDCSRHGRQFPALVCDHVRYAIDTKVFASRSEKSAWIECEECADKEESEVTFGLSCIECYIQICFRNTVIGTVNNRLFHQN